MIFSDCFTPLTVERFTGKHGGAIYGSPEKIRDGVIGYDNLVLAGTDQGFLGIVGSMLSGVSMVNQHILSKLGKPTAFAPSCPYPMAVTLTNTKDAYDVIVVGSGLGGLTAANRLARCGYSVLLLEHHHRLGGLATWFKRKGHIFDISLHGFPYGMIKTCKKYWNREIMNSIVQLKNIVFDNPQFSLRTTF